MAESTRLVDEVQVRLDGFLADRTPQLLAIAPELASIAAVQFSMSSDSVMPAGPYLQLTVVDGEARTLLPAVLTAPRGWRIDVNSRGVLGDGRAYRVSEETLRQSIEWTQYYRNRSAPAPEFPIFRFPRAPHVQPDSQYPPPERNPEPPVVRPPRPPILVPPPRSPAPPVIR